MVPHYVLDAFAYLALVFEEPAADRVYEVMAAARRGEVQVHLSMVNVAEIAYRIERKYSREAVAEGIDRLLRLKVVLHEVDLDLSLAAAGLKRPGVSLGDAFAAALAIRLDATLLTGDPEFKRLKDVVRIEWLPRR